MIPIPGLMPHRLHARAIELMRFMESGIRERLGSMQAARYGYWTASPEWMKSTLLRLCHELGRQSLTDDEFDRRVMDWLNDHSNAPEYVPRVVDRRPARRSAYNPPSPGVTAFDGDADGQRQSERKHAANDAHEPLPLPPGSLDAFVDEVDFLPDRQP